MTDPISRAAELLFPTEGNRTRNIKFVCAGSQGYSARELAEVYLRAEAQISSGRARVVTDADAV